MDKQNIIEMVKGYFMALPTLNPNQKNILRERVEDVAEQIRQNTSLSNWPKNEREVQAFKKEMERVIIHANTPFQFPPYEGEWEEINPLMDLLLTDQSIKKFSEHPVSPVLFGNKKDLFLEELRKYFQILFKTAFETFKDFKEEKEILWGEGVIGNLLSYYTLLNPPEGEVIQIPLFENSRWDFVEYRMEKVPLTPTWLGQRSYAFGLTSEKDSPPLLLFKGTSYPTDEGFFFQLLSDVNPFCSVGKYLFSSGSKEIESWFQKVKGKARVYGLSLGGALTEHTVANYPDKIKTAFAYNPPALLKRDLKKWDAYLKKGKNPLPQVHIFITEHDIVSCAGDSLGQGWHVYKLLGKLPRGVFIKSILAHVKCLMASPHHLLIRSIPNPNFSFFRYFILFFHLMMSIPLFIVGALDYLIYLLFVKIFRFIFKTS